TSHETARLDELRLDAVEERIEADLELGRHRELVAELEALASEHPLRERPARPADAGPVSLGPPGGGLALVSRCARRLVQELGLERTPELQELERAILRQDPEIVYGAGAARAPGNNPRQQGELMRVAASGGGSTRIPVGSIPIAADVEFGSVWVADARDRG